MTRVCIHQPDFAPWLGFFDRLLSSDIFIVLDDVQFLRRAWHHRDRILGSSGPQWLTVPVQKKGRYDQLIGDVLIDESRPWRQKHLRTLESCYRNAPNFAAVHAQLEEIYDRQHQRLIDLNMDLIRFLLTQFDLQPSIVMSSEFGLQSRSTAKLIELCQAVDADHYLSGVGARNYLEPKLFEQARIELEWQDFKHPEYDQGRNPFCPGLSSLDALYRCGAQSAALIRSSN